MDETGQEVGIWEFWGREWVWVWKGSEFQLVELTLVLYVLG